MGYGYEVKELNDRKVDAARKMVQLAGETLPPGALLVNELPFCGCSLSLSYRTISMLIPHQYDTSLNGFLG
jgi:hypothetical protein